MITIIDQPDNIDQNLLVQLVDFVEEGDQVERKYIERGIETADWIALLIDGTEIVTSAILKNPLQSYRNGVFNLAGVETQKDTFKQELGYVVTNPKYEGQKYCQRLLTAFFKTIGSKVMFATTRKPSMAHILKKFGFEKLGNRYKMDLELFVKDSTNIRVPISGDNDNGE